MKTRTKSVALGVFLGASMSGFGQPAITRQPTNQSVSLGANATFQITATGAAPLSYQWRFADLELFSATNRTLVMTNVQLTQAGNYAVVVTNLSGSITSKVAALEVDPAFTKITAGNIVKDGGFSISSAWGDYDDDGFIDLFVANWGGGGITGGGFLYHNDTNGTFTRILSRPPVNNTVSLNSATWGDYDNDGFIDLYVTTFNDANDVPNLLYHNNGNGTFTLVTNITMAQQVQHSFASVWGDFDNDGWLDLFVANFGTGRNTKAKDDILYQSDRQGGFKRISFGTKPIGENYSYSAALGDFDNDRFLDLVVPQGGADTPQHTLLYHNDRNGMFALLTNSVVSADLLDHESGAWGDFDNDGWLDFCVANFRVTMRRL